MEYNPFDNPMVKVTSQSVYNAAKKILGENLDRVYLYGSYARGDYDEESDIDYMVIANLPQKEACAQLMPLSRDTNELDLEYNIVVSTNITSREIFNRFCIASNFFRNILVEGIEIIGH
ncbi:MAG: nucleotidyltransferase domain-containing protein [Firmicutes bacterium]|nr:nucleotidyltransferase domain-containing protein [Bacillota bacterium]